MVLFILRGSRSQLREARQTGEAGASRIWRQGSADTNRTRMVGASCGESCSGLRPGATPTPARHAAPVAAHGDAEEKRHGDFLDAGRDFGDAS
jgi:hypothetical protein